MSRAICWTSSSGCPSRLTSTEPCWAAASPSPASPASPLSSPSSLIRSTRAVAATAPLAVPPPPSTSSSTSCSNPFFGATPNQSLLLPSIPCLARLSAHPSASDLSPFLIRFGLFHLISPQTGKRGSVGSMWSRFTTFLDTILKEVSELHLDYKINAMNRLSVIRPMCMSICRA
ncbi:hypothetical protein QN277_010717 [Acacia crassicarpa]|uniref:Uncharacterized protein n=1 Tax=Acacia crassicarpa TaxID=499986 RepID=A0AAE1JL00_9FABA|nr:hypothetical protein QN277_010717 [Acacia crassicarpa]